ncbi:hypothetical protein GDO78_018389 [Eleutherodactylus coqui]|uniref:Uncharacterized protein n=1 Tax=Eleutherodactylus coqui TaxID=57060 RepID=A0A8J6BI01_ELECQ|nr:hypothetical protein GDO78_018389 [Eleutherodactylus coqui]
MKVRIPEDVYRVLLTAKSDLNDVFIRKFCCTAELSGPPLSSAGAPLKVYEKRLNGGQVISVWRDDLTRQNTDVVVNAANEHLDHIGGLAYALVQAGGPQIVQESRDEISRRGQLTAGSIAVTSAGMLPSRVVVHAVGPVWMPAVADNCKAQLKEAVQNVLQYVSNHSDLHSVAIPAISSGIFGFPLDLCANIIVTTVRESCSNDHKGLLKEIRLVNNDDKTVQAMRAACEQILGSSDTPSRAMASSGSAQNGPSPQEASSRITSSINGLNIHLKTGKIEDEKTDVIVNSISSDLDLSSGAISRAISKKAGDQMQAEMNKKKNQGFRNMIFTRGYKLPCRYVYHVILSWQVEKTLQEATKECLMTALKYRSSSIAFPALGTGNIGLPRHKVADIMTQAVLDFSRAKECKMDVYFVIHPTDKDTFKAFQDKLRASGVSSPKNMEITENQRGLESSAEEMCVSIAGQSSEDEMEAAEWLQGLLSSSPLLIHNNHLLLFGSAEFDTLASGPSSVNIEEDLVDGKVTLKISGPRPEKLLAAVQAERLLLDIQDEFAVSLEEGLLEAAVSWFYEGESESHRYTAKANRELERAYVSGTVTLRTTPGHVIDIMNRTAQENERTFAIHRRCLCDSLRTVQKSATSENWLSQTKTVDPNSQEFKHQRSEFRKAGLILDKMEEVQNKWLSGVFQSKKEEVELRQKKPSTEQLYQLVPRQFCKKICDVGFHRLYATSKDPKHRAGVHFKKHLPNITQRFHVPEKDGPFCILQAEVVIGAATKYNRNQPVLPCAGPDPLQLYDTLIDGALPPEHYVIFDRFQAKPQYVFTCRHIG